MSQLHPLGPLDFDYERFPGVALRATDQSQPGQALTDRPREVIALAKRIVDLIEHVTVLVISSSLLSGSAKAAVWGPLQALRIAVDRLKGLLLLWSSPQSRSGSVQMVADAAGVAFAALLYSASASAGRMGKDRRACSRTRYLFCKGTIPPPQAVTDFLDPRRDRNQLFASWWVQGNNPLCVSGVSLHGIEQAMGQRLDANKYALVMPNDTPVTADAQNRLFWVDFPTLLADLERGDFPVRKLLPKPRVLLAVKPTRPADEPFVPLAIFDDSTNKLVWSDVASPATANDWTRGRCSPRCALTKCTIPLPPTFRARTS